MNKIRPSFTTRRKGSLGFAVIFIVLMLWGFYLLYSGEPKELTPPPTNNGQTENVTPKSMGKELNIADQILRTMVITGVLIVIILIIARWYRRSFADGRIGSRLNIKILGRHYLDARHSLTMVEVAERKLLLGLTDTSISLITEFDADSKVSTDAMIDTQNNRSDLFSVMLNRFGKKRSG